MKKSKLFQYVILWHPTEKQSKEEGSKSKILVEPKLMLAESEASALMAAAMEIPVEQKTNLDQVEIIIRPF